MKKTALPMKDYHIETKDGSGSFNFFTQAATNKKALKNLLTNSFDFKKIVKNDAELTITIKALK
jgi:hypothetical protein